MKNSFIRIALASVQKWFKALFPCIKLLLAFVHVQLGSELNSGDKGLNINQHSQQADPCNGDSASVLRMTVKPQAESARNIQKQLQVEFDVGTGSNPISSHFCIFRTDSASGFMSLCSKMRFFQGWEPLCKFLEKPIPKEDFPHDNKAVDETDITDKMLRDSWIAKKAVQEIKITLALIPIVVLLISCFCYYCL